MQLLQNLQQFNKRVLDPSLEIWNITTWIAIISVGYRVNSIRGTQFRIWATERLKEYLVKGFSINDERLKGADNDSIF